MPSQGYKVLDFPPKMHPRIFVASPATTFSLLSLVFLFGPKRLTCLPYQVTSYQQLFMALLQQS